MSHSAIVRKMEKRSGICIWDQSPTKVSQFFRLVGKSQHQVSMKSTRYFFSNPAHIITQTNRMITQLPSTLLAEVITIVTGSLGWCCGLIASSWWISSHVAMSVSVIVRNHGNLVRLQWVHWRCILLVTGWLHVLYWRIHH